MCEWRDTHNALQFNKNVLYIKPLISFIRSSGRNLRRRNPKRKHNEKYNNRRLNAAGNTQEQKENK